MLYLKSRVIALQGTGLAQNARLVFNGKGVQLGTETISTKIIFAEIAGTETRGGFVFALPRATLPK